MAVANWNKAWDKYHPNLLGRKLHKERIKVLKEVLTIPKTSVIIDVGCGCGDTLSIIRGLGYQNSIGIDASVNSMIVCQKKYGFEPDVDIFFKDAMQTGYPDKYVDMVFSQGMLEHYDNFDDFRKIIGEICRISRKWVLLLQPDQDSLFGLIKKLWENTGHSSWASEFYYSKKYYVDRMKAHGFKLVKSGSINWKEEMYLLFEREL